MMYGPGARESAGGYPARRADRKCLSVRTVLQLFEILSSMMVYGGFAGWIMGERAALVTETP